MSREKKRAACMGEYKGGQGESTVHGKRATKEAKGEEWESVRAVWGYQPSSPAPVGKERHRSSDQLFVRLQQPLET